MRMCTVWLCGTIIVWLAQICKAAFPGDVVINEIMWMGTWASTADEWIELRSLVDSPIDLSGWTLEGAGSGGDTLTIPDGMTIPAKGYFLIANYASTASNTMLSVEPDWVISALSLANTKLQIILKDREGTVIDVADDGVGAPAAGDKENKASMVRNDPPGDGTLLENWHTATESKGWKEGATEKGTPQSSMMGIEEEMPAEQEGVVVINELMWMGSSVSIADEWIELRNLVDSSIDLSGWTLEGAGSGGDTLTIPDGMHLPARGYFLIANYSSTASKTMLSVEPDWVISALSLPNTKLQIILKDREGQVIDMADDGVGAPAAGDSESKASMVRNDPPGDGTLPENWHTATESRGWKEEATEQGTPQNSLMGTAVEQSSWGKVKTSFE